MLFFLPPCSVFPASVECFLVFLVFLTIPNTRAKPLQYKRSRHCSVFSVRVFILPGLAFECLSFVGCTPLLISFSAVSSVRVFECASCFGALLPPKPYAISISPVSNVCFWCFRVRIPLSHRGLNFSRAKKLQSTYRFSGDRFSRRARSQIPNPMGSCSMEFEI